jgi:hypothetical protein
VLQIFTSWVANTQLGLPMWSLLLALGFLPVSLQLADPQSPLHHTGPPPPPPPTHHNHPRSWPLGPGHHHHPSPAQKGKPRWCSVLPVPSPGSVCLLVVGRTSCCVLSSTGGTALLLLLRSTSLSLYSGALVWQSKQGVDWLYMPNLYICLRFCFVVVFALVSASRYWCY